MTTQRDARSLGRAWDPNRIPGPGLRAALAAAGAVAVIAALLAIRDATTWRTTYAGTPEAAIADLTAGLGLVVSGLVLSAERSLRHTGHVLVLLGIAWLAADVVGWQGASPHLRVLATAGAVLLVPMLLDVVATAPPRTRRTATLRRLVAAGYILAAAVATLLVLTRDPLEDSSCWDLCSANPFLLEDLSFLESGLAAGVALLALGGGAAIVAIGTARLIRATTPARYELAPILLPGLAAGLLVALRPLVAAWRGAAGPSDTPSMALFQLAAWALAALALGAVIIARRRRRMWAALHALASEDPGASTARTAAQALAVATGDASLKVAYPLPAMDGYVDGAGGPVEVTESERRALTTITRAGECVAVVEHDPDRVDTLDLAEHIGPAVRLSMENERLDAELLARAREVRASRARIVAAADLERVRRERALHDGAQQRLLALTYDLRAARQAAERFGEAVAIEHLDEAVTDVHAAHDELRELAHGIYPAVLGEAGLGPALEGLAGRARIPVRLELSHVIRCGRGAEMTAYVIADELVRDAASRGSTYAGLTAAVVDGTLVIDAEDDGEVPAAPIIHGLDRAAAAGGELTLSSHEGVVRNRLEVPCASL